MKASVEHIREKFAFTERRACRLLLVPVSSYRYRPRQNDNSLRERLIALAREKPRFGYRRLHMLLGREGEQVNHKRVHRIYREAGLALRRKKRKHRSRSHPAGQAHAERLRGELQQQTARGLSSRQLVPEPVRSKTDHCQLAQRLQPKEATQQPELQDAVGVRRKSWPWKRRRPSLLEKR